MANAPHDGNFVPAGLGVSSSDSTVTVPFYIDSITGRLLLDVYLVTDPGAGVIASEPDLRDQNRVTAMLCTPETGSTLGIPAVDNRSNNIFLDVVVE